MSTGEDAAWEVLEKLSPDDVCRRAGVIYDRDAQTFELRSFSQDLYIDPKTRSISSPSAKGLFLLAEMQEYSILSALHYLIHAKDLANLGRLVKPGSIAGGDLFMRGTHALPLDKIEERFGYDKDGFIEKGVGWGGEPMEYGDASLCLSPFPRTPMVVVLWIKDDEFPARAELLFYSSCKEHFPLDIVWATSMMTVSILLR